VKMRSVTSELEWLMTELQSNKKYGYYWLLFKNF
jgi:hypothetical protein